ncbi:chromate efflux transporter [Aureimonas sp. AU12]|uniref:chromate efflux transporter n=1 Tax=Aureimonas sp. AU12 TaxID=1638161 RepID=UPI000AC9D39F|nr:chromate efflux transporter [Aureimonas sp. AU12]
MRTRPASIGPAHGVSFREAAGVFARIAALSFGGPAGQIAVMHRILVEEKRWIGEARFLHALNFCMLLPGPEAQQLGTYIGWLLHGTRGGLMAGLLFVLPGFVAMLGLSFVYVAFGHVPLVAGLLFGLKAAVIAIVLQAVLRIGGRALRTPAARIVAALAFLAIFAGRVPFPAIVLGAGLVGFFAERLGFARFTPAAHAGGSAGAFDDAGSALGAEMPVASAGDRRAARRVCLLVAAVWLLPVAVLLLWLGRGNVFAEIALFFSQMAVVTFGGAYAVLAYVAQQAVELHGWLRPGEMLDGLGLAETTPGPLIMVTQFVGFLGAFRQPGSLDPFLAGTLGAVLTTFVTFAPCFLWIFAGAPFVERLRGHRALGAALAAISAAVVGVIANLALWFAVHALFRQSATWAAGPFHLELPVLASLDPAACLLTVAAMVGLFVLKLGVPLLIAVSAVAGALWALV